MDSCGNPCIWTQIYWQNWIQNHQDSIKFHQGWIQRPTSGVIREVKYALLQVNQVLLNEQVLRVLRFAGHIYIYIHRTNSQLHISLQTIVLKASWRDQPWLHQDYATQSDLKNLPQTPVCFPVFEAKAAKNQRFNSWTWWFFREETRINRSIEVSETAALAPAFRQLRPVGEAPGVRVRRLRDDVWWGYGSRIIKKKEWQGKSPQLVLFFFVQKRVHHPTLRMLLTTAWIWCFSMFLPHVKSRDAKVASLKCAGRDCFKMHLNYLLGMMTQKQQNMG